MLQFLIDFTGLNGYEFLLSICACIISSLIFFMFYTIVASLFRMR